jgi:hypothetical protein
MQIHAARVLNEHCTITRSTDSRYAEIADIIAFPAVPVHTVFCEMHVYAVTGSSAWCGYRSSFLSLLKAADSFAHKVCDVLSLIFDAVDCYQSCGFLAG